MSRTLTGRLVFKQAGPAHPLHNLTFAASVYRPLLPDTHLGVLRSDADGRFAIPVSDDDSFTLRLAFKDSHRRYAGSQARDEEVDAGHVDVDVKDANELGEIEVTWWPYRTDFPTPRAQFIKRLDAQHYTRGFELTLAKSVAMNAPTQGLLTAMNKLDSDKPCIEEIQKHQPETLTIRVDKETPGRSRSDAWLADQLLNGFDIELRVGRDADDPSRLRAALRWGELAAKGPYDLSDFDVVMEADEQEVRATQITLRTRQPGAGGAWAKVEEQTFTPADGDSWEAAKRVVRCQYLTHGALDGHITRAHFQTEMFALAAFRNLRLNPARHVLIPHLWEIVAQGKDGDNFAWGPNGILADSSALTTAYMYQRMKDNAGGWDWKTFKPRSVLHPTHRYAKAAKLYWDLIGEYIDAQIDANVEGITAHWVELRRFSEDLVSHSVPYVPQVDDPKVVPADRNELDDPSLPRAVVDGVTRAVRPLTTTDAPAEGELDALKQLCRYLIFQATFNHSWTHNGQYDAGGELAYAVFGLRNGSLGAETDPEINPRPAANVKGISTNSLGIKTNYGFILADEEEDVPPALKAALSKHAEAFRALNVDPGYIRSRINI